jgi:flagellar basal-body rod protein FlgF
LRVPLHPLHPRASKPEARPMQNATTIAVSRLAAQQRAMEVAATNLANADTAGYRAERTIFSDWLQREPGGTRETYAQDRATYREKDPGPVAQTGNPLDLAIGSDGYFTVQTPAGPRLTRAGHFTLSAAGGIVDDNGSALLDPNGRPLQVGIADTHLTVATDGTLSSENGQLGRVALVAPADPLALKAQGNRLYDATGTTTSAVAAPRLIQGALEQSNVQPVAEMTRMMDMLREFQFATEFVQAESDRQQTAIDRILQKRT